MSPSHRSRSRIRPNGPAASLFELVEEIHFLRKSRFQGFAEFEHRILGATHSEFQIDASLHAAIKRRFDSHLDTDGIAVFMNPMRVDLLRKRERSGPT